MFTQAKELLWRQRVIHTFPVDRDEVLCSILPPQLQDFVVTGERDDVKTVQWENLTHCVNLGSTVIIELDGDDSKSFWFGFTKKRPVPVNPDRAFEMYECNPFYKQIVQWWVPAMETHKKLMRYEEALFAFFSKAEHPRLVEKYWPELHKFVDFELSPNQVLSDKNFNKRRTVPMPTDEESTGIIETLAGSTLLDSHECNAWVGYETGDW
jgi:hypothetical protein